MEIVFKIETAGLPKNEILHLMPEFNAPSNYKDAEKIQAYKAKKQEDWFLDASSSALSGKILAIGYQAPMQNANYFVSDREDEILRDFWNFYRKHADCKFVGFGCNSFAIPFLVRRSWANRVIIPNIFRGRFLNGNFLDLLQVWGCGTGEKVSLGNLAKFLGIKYEQPETPFEAMWKVNAYTARDNLITDVLTIRKIGEAMGVLEAEDFQWNQ